MSLTVQPAAAVSTDPLLAPNPNRFVLFPIKYHEVWEMYKKHEVLPPLVTYGMVSTHASQVMILSQVYGMRPGRSCALQTHCACSLILDYLVSSQHILNLHTNC